MSARKTRTPPSPVLSGLVKDAPVRVGAPVFKAPEIERGVPVQEHVVCGRRTPYRRFIEQLQPGDSFVVPEEEAARFINPLRQMVYRHGWAMVSRRDGRGSVRIWRTA